MRIATKIYQEEESPDDDNEWDIVVDKLCDSIDGLSIVRTEDRFGVWQYEWKCRDENGRRVECEKYFGTQKGCLLDFLSRIDGFRLSLLR